MGGSIWETQLQEVKDAQAQGKIFLGVSHAPNSDAAAARYGWATMLLAGGGKAFFALHGDYANENWFPEYDYALGDPAGAERRETSGVHRRAFANGLVLVNPTSVAVHVDFGGSYSGSGLSAATGASVAPRSALVLVKAGGAPFPPDPGPGLPQPTPSPTPSPTPVPTPVSTPVATPTPVPTPVATPTPTPTPPPTVPIKIVCHSHRHCHGTVALVAGGTTLARRTVDVPAGATEARPPCPAPARLHGHGGATEAACARQRLPRRERQPARRDHRRLSDRS